MVSTEKPPKTTKKPPKTTIKPQKTTKKPYNRVVISGADRIFDTAGQEDLESLRITAYNGSLEGPESFM